MRLFRWCVVVLMFVGTLTGCTPKQKQAVLLWFSQHPEVTAFDWDCVANAETGGDFHMHGSHYSSAYGVMNQAVRENAPPEIANKILSGTATPTEQLKMAEEIVVKFGVNAWAKGTVKRCAR